MVSLQPSIPRSLTNQSIRTSSSVYFKEATVPQPGRWDNSSHLRVKPLSSTSQEKSCFGNASHCEKMVMISIFIWGLASAAQWGRCRRNDSDRPFFSIFSSPGDCGWWKRHELIAGRIGIQRMSQLITVFAVWNLFVPNVVWVFRFLSSFVAEVIWDVLCLHDSSSRTPDAAWCSLLVLMIFGCSTCAQLELSRLAKSFGRVT